MTTLNHPPHYEAGLRLQAWVDQQPWKDSVNVAVGIDPATRENCFYLYVQKKREPLAFRPPLQDLPEVWEGVPVRVHQVGPIVAQPATA